MLAKGMEKLSFTLYHQALKHQKKASVYEYFKESFMIFKDAKMLSIFATLYENSPKTVFSSCSLTNII